MFVQVVSVRHIHLRGGLSLTDPGALLSLLHVKWHIVRVLLHVFFKSAQGLEGSAGPQILS